MFFSKMEELPPRPNRSIPFLQIVMTHHNKSPNLENYKSVFFDEQDEILENMHDLNFRILRNHDQLNILDATVITPASRDEVTVTSDSGKEGDSTTKQ